MATRSIEAPLVVIVGPTASGKTALAIRLAEKYNGEIICADSRTVYKRMDIGTAKPTVAEQARVKHWGLDLVEPNERFTAADFKTYAVNKIADIRSRGKVPLLVGGTGLYINAILFDYKFNAQELPNLRAILHEMTVENLNRYCVKNNIKLPENTKNKRYLIRAIEQKGINTSSNSQPLDNTIIVGIATDKQVLRTRIQARIEQLFKNGVVGEAIILGKKYGWDCEAMTANIYRLLYEYNQGNQTLSEIKEAVAVADWRLAKRQLTWFKRNPYITWLDKDLAFNYINSQLDHYSLSVLQ